MDLHPSQNPSLTIRGTCCLLTLKKAKSEASGRNVGQSEHGAFQRLAFDKSGAAESWAWVRVTIRTRSYSLCENARGTARELQQ